MNLIKILWPLFGKLSGLSFGISPSRIGYFLIKLWAKERHRYLTGCTQLDSTNLRIISMYFCVFKPVVGLSIALALTFLVLIILLALLCAKCCRLCCPSRARKTSKYYVNPMPSYKSIEPIYIVTPAGR